MDNHVQQTMWDLRKQRDRVQSILDSMTALFGEPGPEGQCQGSTESLHTARKERVKPGGARALKGGGKRGPYKKRAVKEGEGKSQGSTESLPTTRIQRVVPGGEGKITMSSAIRAVVSDVAPGKEFGREFLKEQILVRWPELAPKINSTSVYLIDFVERGELKRKGSGADALFTMGKLKEAREVSQPMMRRPAKAPSEREQAWRNIRGEDVQVPRDAEQPE